MTIEIWFQDVAIIILLLYFLLCMATTIIPSICSFDVNAINNLFSVNSKMIFEGRQWHITQQFQTKVCVLFGVPCIDATDENLRDIIAKNILKWTKNKWCVELQVYLNEISNILFQVRKARGQNFKKFQFNKIFIPC